MKCAARKDFLDGNIHRLRILTINLLLHAFSKLDVCTITIVRQAGA